MNSSAPVRSLTVLISIAITLMVQFASGAIAAKNLRTEWLTEPLGLDSTQPRLSWQVEANGRGAKQSAYRIIVATSKQELAKETGTLWDSGKVLSDETLNIQYGGKPLTSGARVFWKVQLWDKQGKKMAWSEPTSWSMGLLKPGDWTAKWISFRDTSPVHASRKELQLPPARHYRKTFTANKRIARATLYASALGIAEFHINGKRVAETFFEPGWSDYHKRVYYRTHDVTELVRRGENCIGAVVTDGWYAGYVGYGVLVGYGPNKSGRNFYGKTPALLAQVELEYSDGSRARVETDTTWDVTSDGPVREADLVMGESCDARRDAADWATVSPRPQEFAAWTWNKAIRAEENGTIKATYHDTLGSREVELGFQRPLTMQAYGAPPIRVIQELETQRLTEPKPGVYIFDLGQNFAGTIRLKVKASAGTKLQLRFGEMLHTDGRLMTENLRRARVTDYYVCRGGGLETWVPRFTYHGFQYVEITGLPTKPDKEMVTGLVLHNDTPLIGSFACSDEVMTKFGQNAQWTQRANFVELPTDCPQRDERLGWMGDAQVYVRTATYNADVAAFFNKWVDDVREAQRDSGAYPDYCPYPMAHGSPGATHATAWTDAGVIVPYTIWKVYADTQILERHWQSMTKFMEWRRKTDAELKGVKVGNTWGDWLNVNENTPIEYIDLCYHAFTAGLMAEMAEALAKTDEAAKFRDLRERISRSYAAQYLRETNGAHIPKIETQTACVLPLWMGLLPDQQSAAATAARLAARIEQNGVRMATGFIGTKPLLPALTKHGHHDLAVRLFQSRRFPSWGYEVVNGANTVWERWDSFTKEHGFNGASGNQNASMNSFSHYSFGAVMEWAYRDLAGIDTDGPAFKRILIRPHVPPPSNTGEVPVISWVNADYGSARGRIGVKWKRESSQFHLEVVIPGNCTALVHLPSRAGGAITENGKPFKPTHDLKLLRREGDRVLIEAGSGAYRFTSEL